MTGPLEGIRVIEMGQLLAGPYCGQLLADYGAEVIKIEQPGVGDPLREWGRDKANGQSLWWPIAARGKKSVTLNARGPEGQAIVRELVAGADIFLENFRPGTMERWNLGWDDLSAVNPRLIMIRVSGYGQTGPYATKPGYASVGEAMGGLRYVMGDPDQPPSRAGISIGDSLAAMFACLGGLAALFAAERTGRGQVVDSSIYESVLAVMESLVPEYSLAGFTRERTGSYLPNVAPSNVYPTRDGRMVIIAANQDQMFGRLCTAMGRPDLATDERYVDHTARGTNQIELDQIIAEWTSTHDAEALMALLEEHSVVVGNIYRAMDMLADPHFKARGSIITKPHPVHGDFPMQAIFPRFSEDPCDVRWVGPELGQHNEDVLGGLLGYDDARIAQLAADGVI